MPFNFEGLSGEPAPDVETVVLKNWQKWYNVEPMARFPLRGLVPMKMPFRATDRHASNHTVESLLAAYRVTRIIDLQSDGEAYALDPSVCERIRLFSKSKAAPARELVAEFIALVESHMAMHPGVCVAVHCHYGFNRTGFLTAAYLIECHCYSPTAAIDEFARARPPGIKHEHFKQELHARYGGVGGRWRRCGRQFFRRLARNLHCGRAVTPKVALVAAAIAFAAVHVLLAQLQQRITISASRRKSESGTVTPSSTLGFLLRLAGMC